MHRAWTPDEIEMAAQVGAAMMSIEDMATIVGGIEGLLYDQIKSECALHTGALFIAYTSAFLKAEMEIRQSVIDLAKKGSSPAQSMAMDYIRTAKSSNVISGG